MRVLLNPRLTHTGLSVCGEQLFCAFTAHSNINIFRYDHLTVSRQ
jgi:hypothetical protein